MSLQSPKLQSGLGLADKVQIQRTIKTIVSKWYVPCLLLLLSVILVELHTRYRTNSFTSMATIEIIEESSPSSFLSIDLFESAFSRTDKIMTEAEVIKTKALIMAALEEMSYEVSYKKVGTFNSFELYRRAPVVIVTESSQLKKPRFVFDLEVTSMDDYNLVISVDGKETTIKGNFGQPQEYEGQRFNINKSEDSYAHELETGSVYRLSYLNKETLATIIQNRLQVVSPAENTSILQIRFTWNNAIFAQDFLSALVNQYLLDDFESKSEMAGNVIVFIDNQLKELSAAVDSYESRISDFKSENTLVDIESEAGQSMRALYELETEKRLIEVELINMNALLGQLQNRKPREDISFGTQGLIDPALIKSVSELNRLQLEKISLAAELGPQNKRLEAAENQIEELVNSIINNVQSGVRQLNDRKGFFEGQIKEVYDEFKEIPGFQREYLNLSRNFEVNEKVFSLLLEKKLSAQISKASVVPSVKLLDKPDFPNRPNAITKSKLHVFGGVTAVFLGISLLACISFFDDKIYSKQDLQAATDLPILGQLTKAPVTADNTIVKATDKSRSIFSESIKALRANIDFFATTKEETQVICTTSTVSGEGKSFVTANLASAYASLGKKTILIDLDMRKPRVHKFFDAKNDVGVSNVLIGAKTIDEVVKYSEPHGLSFICAGVIPPNPGELLQSKHFGEFIETLKKEFDTIMLDTPPIGIISDSLFAMKAANTTMYVLKSEYSKTSFLTVPLELTEKHKIQNFNLLLNAVAGQRTGYGGYSSSYYYKSGYFVNEGKKGFLRRNKS